jgi:hypothetical protein
MCAMMQKLRIRAGSVCALSEVTFHGVTTDPAQVRIGPGALATANL